MVSAIISSGEKGDADLQAVRTCGERTKEWSLLVNVVVASSRGRYCRKANAFAKGMSFRHQHLFVTRSTSRSDIR
jgi:hypothetical protein